MIKFSVLVSCLFQYSNMCFLPYLLSDRLVDLGSSISLKIVVTDWLKVLKVKFVTGQQILGTIG